MLSSTCNHLQFLPFVFLYLLPSVVASDPLNLVGVSYRASNPYVSNVSHVVDVLKELGVRRVRIIDANPKTLSYYLGTNITINLSLEDHDTIFAMGKDPSIATKWVKDMVVSTGRQVTISTITLGSDLLMTRPNDINNLVKALENLSLSLREFGFVGTKVTTKHSNNVMEGVFPPSKSKFQVGVLQNMIRLLTFLNKSESPFQIDLYPYTIVKAPIFESDGFKFAMFRITPDTEDCKTDPTSKRKYSSIIHMMIDSVITAATKVGFPNIPIEVSGTGWPAKDANGSFNHEATVLNAGEYNQELMSVVNSGVGTPMRPEEEVVVYVNGLVDDEEEEGFMGCMGVLNEDLSLRYNLEWKVEDSSATKLGWVSTTAIILLMFL